MCVCVCAFVTWSPKSKHLGLVTGILLAECHLDFVCSYIAWREGAEMVQATPLRTVACSF